MRRLLALAAVLTLLASCRGGRTEAAFVPASGGDAERGRALIAKSGCGACHQIPGVRKAKGWVGPPLTAWSRRTFIAGQVPNTPENLVRWIVDPHSIEEGTAMPAVGLDVRQARDVAAYLYTLD